MPIQIGRSSQPSDQKRSFDEPRGVPDPQPRGFGRKWVQQKFGVYQFRGTAYYPGGQFRFRRKYAIGTKYERTPYLDAPAVPLQLLFDSVSWTLGDGWSLYHKGTMSRYLFINNFLIWTCLGLSGLVWTCLHLSGLVWTRLDFYKCTVYLNLVSFWLWKIKLLEYDESDLN